MFWQYTTKLELDSPRFSQPGDFATYVAFICAIILVSQSVSLQPSFIEHLAFLPGQVLVSDSVPGERGRLPLRDVQSIIRISQKRLHVA